MQAKRVVMRIFVIAILITVFWQTDVAKSGVVTDGLLSYWTFDTADIAGQTARDVWGERDAAIKGQTSGVAGKNGDALQFDGNGDYVEFDDAGLPEGGAPRTMSAWIKPAGAGVRSVLEWGTSASGQRCAVLILADQKIKFCGQDADVTSNGYAVNGEWHHVTETYDGATLRIYIDGVLDIEQVVSIDTVLNVGRIGANVRLGEFFNGAIDEVGIYDRAINDEEVAENFAAERGPCAGNPEDEATDVSRDVVLSWLPGEFPCGYDVYLGTAFEDVNNASRANCLDVLVSQDQNATAYDPVRLEFGQTYYWRIDEIGAPPECTIAKGQTWSFTTEPVGYPLAGDRITVTASSTNKPEEGVENIISGLGLDGENLHSVTVKEMWRTSRADPDPWIEFAFDKPYKLHEMLVWNHNSALELTIGYGIKEATVEYSLDGTDWVALDPMEFAQATGRSGYQANTAVAFDGALVQYVRVRPTSNWGGILPQFGLSEVRFLCVPLSAREPDPASGAADVAARATLNWRAGRQGALHDVYLSSDEQAVVDGTAPVVTVSEPFLDTEPLDLLGTYYWRVDEVNEAEDPALWRGDIWNFTVTDVVVVEDFEAYTDDEGNRIYETWVDGWGVPTNGSQVGYSVPPFAEETILHAGSQSMPFLYDNTSGAADSVATRTFAEAQDWTTSGVQGLVLYFCGSPDNTGGQLYVKINGTRVAYDSDAGNLMRTGWNKWYIALADVAGVNLARVTTLSIGVDNGGEGVLYIDDISLTPYERQMITPVEPGTTNLVAHFAFDGNASDSTGKHPGRLAGGSAFAPGVIGQALNLDGVGSYVEITGYKGVLGANAVTATAWIRTSSTITGSIVGWGGPLGASGHTFELAVNGNRLRFEPGGGTFQGQTVINDGAWHHVAVTVQADATMSYPEVVLWVDGRDDTRPTSNPNKFDLSAAHDVRIGSRPVADDRYFVGQIDEMRLYDRALSVEEIVWLAGYTMPFDE